jgi:hypothetical protein
MVVQEARKKVAFPSLRFPVELIGLRRLDIPWNQFDGLKLPAKLQLLRQHIMKKEGSTNGEYDILDITRYFK